ncbi:ABC-2 type transport system ATP-binding protein [Streptacidiphilus sp. MAP12-16]|uniref:ABC transporter ATP-binding protein n=1 Tax=Streptacidiphilus sp. MAP12-16 TaxID=3156300 RepID=UPI0035153CA5
MIEAQQLTKRYGTTLAVDDLSFTVAAGQVTGFLGPNGSGKSTTMRMIVGLDAPSAGRITVAGRSYSRLRFPLHEVGALLDANAVHPGRSARNHLVWLADSNGIARQRVDVVLAMVGLTEVAHRRAGTFSLGMGQRLGIAVALLGDPQVLIFDEPINGLDPEGILWVRRLLRSLADEGRTVLVSSHLMSEMALTADHLIVIGRGRLLATGRVADFIEQTSGHHVRAATPEASTLTTLLREKGATVTADGTEGLSIKGMECRDVGILAAGAGLTLYELSAQRASLEDAYMELTHEHADFRATADSPLRSTR